MKGMFVRAACALALCVWVMGAAWAVEDGVDYCPPIIIQSEGGDADASTADAVHRAPRGEDGVQCDPEPPPPPAPSGSISATACQLPSSTGSCTSTISWSSNQSSAQVHVQPAGGGAWQLFASGQNGSQNAPWISLSGYRFELRAGTNVLASRIVQGTLPPQQLKGTLEAVTTGTPPRLTGWACLTRRTDPVHVHIYAGGDAQSGTGIFAGAANVSREPAVGQQCDSSTTAYGFSVPLTDDIRAAHGGGSVFAYAIAPAGSGLNNLMLPGSGQRTVPPLPPAALLGNVDRIVDRNGVPHLAGWACLERRESPIQVQMYAGGASGSGGALVGTATANVLREAGVGAACKTSSTSFGYEIPLTDDVRFEHAGKSLHVHAMHPSNGSNRLLPGSGTLQVPTVSTPPGTRTTPDRLSDRVGATAGEFRVDESGAATYTIPLSIPSGRAGVAPEVALTYSSQGGDGPLGRGWGISAGSAIARCRRSREAGDFIVSGQPVDGNAGPIDFSANDALCLDGQRLLELPAGQHTGCPAVGSASVMEYRTEIESFQRVCGYTFNPTAGPRFFTVEGKDGSRRHYGDRRANTTEAVGPVTDAVMESQAHQGTAPILSWGLTRFQDSMANFIDYEYLKNPGHAQGFLGEQLLHRIRFTGNANTEGGQAVQHPFASVTFNYAALPTSERTRTFASGSMVSSTRFLQSVDIASDGTTLRQYRLAYAPGTADGRSRRLTSLTECLDGTTGFGEVCLQPTTFQWSQAENAFQALETVHTSQFKDLVSYRLGDVDGDGRLDLVWFARPGAGCTSARMMVSYGEFDAQGRLNFATVAQQQFCSGIHVDDIDASWHLLDYNGNGRDDLFIGRLGTWRIHPSVGRPSGSGQQAFNIGTNLIANLSPAIPVMGRQLQPMLADISGNGLLDVVYNRDGAYRVRLMERGANNAFSWSSERALYAPPVCEDVTDPNIIGQCGYTSISRVGGSVILNDFDGDGRSDILMRRTWQEYVGGPGCDTQIPRGDGGRTGARSARGGAAEPAYSPLAAEGLDAALGGDAEVQSWQCYRTNDALDALVIDTVSANAVTLRRYGSWDITSQPVNFERDGLFRFSDLTGNGLADLLFKVGNEWRVHLNNGRSFQGPVTTVGSIPNEGSMQLVDVNGNGRADLVYPRSNNSQGRPFVVRYARGDGGFLPEQPLPGGGAHACISGGCDPNSGIYVFADFSSDGAPEFLRIFPESGRMDISRAAPASRYQARQVIHRIRDGLGNFTEVKYGLMAFTDLHRRASGSRDSRVWGRGSPVQDFSAPMYLVASAESSSPAWNATGARSRLHYRYYGARMQAGGRGFLGFERVVTFDPNHASGHVATFTRYRQDFPFTGMPVETETRRLTGTWQEPQCLRQSNGVFNQVDNNCFAGQGGGDVPVGGQTLSHNLQSWELHNGAHFMPGIRTAQQVRNSGSDERRYDLDTFAALSRVLTTFDYDTWGNVTSTSVDTQTHTGSAWRTDASVETVNVYANTPAHWVLGRLTRSDVTHRRGGQSDVRTSTFEYQAGGRQRGLLIRERVQPGGGADQDLSTWYTYDRFGNRIESYTCSSHLSAAQCRTTAIDFQPADPLRIHRYSRVVYDSQGRHVVETREPFRAGGANPGAATEHATQRVDARDVFGNPTRTRDINGSLSTALSGSLGRPYYAWVQSVPGATAGNPAQGVESFTTHRWCSSFLDAEGGVSCPAGAVFRTQVERSDGHRSWSYIDGMGRSLLDVAHTSRSDLYGKGLTASCSGYDVRGRLQRVSEPFHVGRTNGQPDPSANVCTVSARRWTLTELDMLDRPTRVIHPDTSDTLIAYLGLAEVHTNQSGHTRTEYKNALGELERVVDANGFELLYRYNVFGNLVEVERSTERGAITTTMAYDRMGRKIFQDDPDAGIRTYRYNALGELVEQEDVEGNLIRQWYDARGRMVRRVTQTAAGVVEAESTWLFDTATHGLGQLAEERIQGTYLDFTPGGSNDLGFERSYGYDPLGRVTGTSTFIDGVGYHTQTVFDAKGRVFRERDPSGRWTKNEYSSHNGALMAVCESSAGDTAAACPATGASVHLRILEHDERGNVVHERRGGSNAMQVWRRYDAANGQLLEICAGSSRSTCTLQDDTYEWSASGNLTARGKAGQYREEFTYDALDRLTLARYTQLPGVGSVSVVNEQVEYDQLGNICQKLVGGQLRDFTYAGRAGCGTGGRPGGGSNAEDLSPHQVVQANNRIYHYDARGNQTLTTGTGRVGEMSALRQIHYTLDDRAYGISSGMVGSTSFATRFWYGPDGQRYKRQDGSRRTLYVGNLEIVSQGGATVTKRYVAGVMVQEISGSSAVNKYLLHDHLGSVVRVLNSSGHILEGADFAAFGQRRGYVDPRDLAPTPQTTDRGYTGHEHVDSFDIVHMNGRLYDYTLGRFLQADPFVQAPNNSQNYNRYTYVLNNPLSYNDPSGYLFKKIWNNKWFRTAVAIAITVWTGGQAAELGWTWAGAAWAAGGGFAAGVVGGGGVKSGLYGAFTAVAFLGVGSFANSREAIAGSRGWGASGWKRVVAHGFGGGVTAQLQGGSFGSGFASAGLSKAATPLMASGNIYRDGFAVAIVGGTTSKLTGGKFANGAITAAMAFAFNELQSLSLQRGESHSFSREGDVNWDEWSFSATVNPSGWMEINAGQEILLEFRSDAFPPTEQWYVEVKARPLNTDGSLQNVHAQSQFFEPRKHSVLTGEMVAQRFRANGLLPNEGGYRWSIRIPPQAATHGNSSWRAVNVYEKVPLGD